MSSTARYGLEQARIHLPTIVANAHLGQVSIITRHGRPYAAVIPVEDLQKVHGSSGAPSALLALSGSGRGLWGADVGQTIDSLRDEWDQPA